MKSPIRIAAGLAALAFSPALAQGAEGAEGGGGSWLRLLFFVINFALFVFILVYFAAPLVRKFFSDRSGEIRGTLARAGAAFEQAQNLADESRTRLEGLEAEKARLLAELNAETAHQVRTVREMALSAAERIKRDAEMTAAAMADAAERRMRHRLAAAVTAQARGIITRDFQDADQGRLLTGFMDKLKEEAGT